MSRREQSRIDPRGRKVKILATVGPASRSPDMLARLIRAGADAFRINMSHGTHADHEAAIQAIRALEKQFARPIAILADLQGPKLRVGTFKNGQAVIRHSGHFVLDRDETPGDEHRVCLPHPELFGIMERGQRLLINDGKIRLKVIEADAERILCSAEVGGVISDRKGVNVPDAEVPIPAMTEKDSRDLAFATEHGADWIALSFVQRPEDIAEARRLIGTIGTAICAKIEKPQAIARLDEIMEISDALMVARGDLGVEMPLEKVPGLQKRITRNARRLGKPVVVATQMLESMITSPVPTRAEVSDVATAVFDGADAVMLSAESAAGDFPIEAVSTMNRIAEEVENDPLYRSIIANQRASAEATGADAIAMATRDVAETLDLKAIVAWTASGATGLRISRERPEPPILALTPIVNTARRLALAWGVHAIVTEDARDVDDMATRACQLAAAEGFAHTSQRIIVVAGVPFGTPGATNMIRIAFVQ